MCLSRSRDAVHGLFHAYGSRVDKPCPSRLLQAEVVNIVQGNLFLAVSRGPCITVRVK